MTDAASEVKYVCRPLRKNGPEDVRMWGRCDHKQGSN